MSPLNKRFYHVLRAFCLFITGILLTSCGDDDDGDSPSATAKVSMDLIQGTWTSECFERDGSHIMTSQEFSELNYGVASKIYSSNSDCTAGQNLTLLIKETGSYALGTDIGLGNTEIDRTPTGLKVTISNDTGASATKIACAFAENSNITNPQAGSEIELIEDSCLGIFQSPPYNLVKIRDNVMFAGDTESIEAQNGKESGSRPQNIGAALPFKK